MSAPPVSDLTAPEGRQALPRRERLHCGSFKICPRSSSKIVGHGFWEDLPTCHSLGAPSFVAFYFVYLIPSQMDFQQVLLKAFQVGRSWEE